MKNKGLIIVLLILLSVIVFFLCMFLVTCLTNGSKFGIGFINWGSKSKNVIMEKTYELSDINNIQIKQNAGNITFRESSDNNIKVVIYGENESDANISLDNSDLNIECNRKNHFFTFGVAENDIVIYVPTTFENEITIKSDYGNCEMSDLPNATLNVDSDAGNVEIGKIKNVVAKCDYGNIEIDEVLNKCEIKADCGNIEIDTVSIKENSTIKADLGNVDIEHANDVYIDADVDLGKVRITENNRNSDITLNIECDCGNVTVENK